MNQIPGIEKPDLMALPRIRDRLSFLYVERCVINRDDGAVTITDSRGSIHVPAATLTVLMLGPGTNISHRAVELIGQTGISVVWVGEQGVRYYAHGRPLAQSTRLLMRQAELVSNVRSRLAVARTMYQMRFPEEDVSALTMQQLRGREGARVRSSYRQLSRDTGVKWSGRDYDPNDFSSGDGVNRALSAANACLYGVVQSVIVALGCAPGLGFIHTGHERAFVYDVADLYKAEISIPVAFEVAAENPEDIGGVTRRRVRDRIADGYLLRRCVKDIRTLLLQDNAREDDIEVETLQLWDNRHGAVRSGISYAELADGRNAPEDEL